MKLNVVDGQLTNHFNISEFCHNGELYIDERFLDFVNCLEDFRIWYKRPINVTSCYRPTAFNKAVGGSPNSSHLFSLAVDFHYPVEYFKFDPKRKEDFLTNVRLKWARLCVKYGYVGQTNFYDNRFHLGFSLNGKYSFRDERSK